MADVAVVCPLGHAGEGYRIIKDGARSSKTGRRQSYRCVDADDVAHYFRVAQEPPKPVSAPTLLRCPRPGHKDATLQSRGTRTTSTGSWRRYLCTRPNGDRHTFQVMLSEADVPVAAPASPPPKCPEHPESKVKRSGTYGRRIRRQRYLCRPEDGKAHQFTPPLSREAVSPGDSCTRCDELLSPHHGPVTAARHTPWTLTGVAQALNDLSLGESYANVSLALRAQRDTAREHLSAAHGIETFPATPAPVATSAESYSRRERRNAWRVAADLVEQYAPPLFAEIEQRLRAASEAQRVANDALLEVDPNATLPAPLVYVLDELPVWTRTNKVKRPTWNVLTVAEVGWKNADDPFMLPERDTRLRVARAFPRSNADAWQLVLDELGVRPDFVVADYGTGLQGALRTYYGPSVGVVPSLWHVHRNIRDVLLALPNTTFQDGKERVLLDPLRKHMSSLARDELIGRTALDIAQWWDDLEALVASLPAPVSTIQAQRELQEPRLVDALPILNANPHVPASNAAVENRIRVALKPFLENRSHLFGNQERTNRLLNLLICREAGLFTNMEALTLRVRQLNEANGGWAPAPRQILDRQPPAAIAQGRRFESLKSNNVVARLAKERGITTRAQAQAAAPIPLLTTRSPQRLSSLAIRDWARSVGLPAGSTGPIKPAVLAAHAAHKNGASDDEVRELYSQMTQQVIDREKRARKGRKVSNAEAKKRTAQLAPIRKWAADNGYDLPAHSPITKAIQTAYDAAQKGDTTKTRPSRQPRKTKS